METKFYSDLAVVIYATTEFDQLVCEVLKDVDENDQVALTSSRSRLNLPESFRRIVLEYERSYQPKVVPYHPVVDHTINNI
jgi:hypothetical protein